MRKTISITAAIMTVAVLLPTPSAAQLNGSHTLGDYGVQSGSQPQPGFYAALFYLRYAGHRVLETSVSAPPCFCRTGSE